MALAVFAVGDAWATSPPLEWNFIARLDGKPIGTHRFSISSAGDGSRSLNSEADFEVRFLGVPLYRYRHRASERWNDGCLTTIQAETDDNGRVTAVSGEAWRGQFRLEVRDKGRSAPGPAIQASCLMSFAYWNPALAGQERLLDPGSGRIEPVAITTPASVPDDLGVQLLTVRGLRIGGLSHPIDVWYAGDRWIGLDTFIGGGRRLSYRLR